MKKVLNALVVGVLLLGALALVGCGKKDDGGQASETPKAEQKEEKKEPLDLTGEWKQSNGSEDSYQAATIKDGVIEVNWISPDTKSLYWSGTYVAPTNDEEPYTWDSENDTEKTSGSILASEDKTKTFTYENGEISYEVSAMGTTKTVRLKKQ